MKAYLLSWTTWLLIMLTAVAAVLFGNQVNQLLAQRARLERRHAIEQQPFGGCKEAWQAPRSEGAQWCREHGYDVPLP